MRAKYDNGTGRRDLLKQGRIEAGVYDVSENTGSETDRTTSNPF